MTSPRQRKKRAAFLARKQKLEQVQPVVTVVEPVVAVVKPPPAVVVSEPKVKKPVGKNALVETKQVEEKKVVQTVKSQDQVVEQTKEEVKTSTGE